MINSKKKYLFIKWSTVISPNILDWIRSIYFSLMGSSMLTFSLKLSTLSIYSLAIFAMGVLSFLLGLLVSVNIANRFKIYEKNYDGLPEATKLIKKPSEYYYEQEIDSKQNFNRRIEHFFFYTLWIPALLCICFAGFHMEKNSTKSNFETKEVLNNLTFKIQKLDSVLHRIDNSYRNSELLQDSLHFIKNDIYLLQNQINFLKKKSNKKKRSLSD